MRIRHQTIRLFILLLAGLFLSTPVSAKSCLWKVTSATGPLYVQGSIHLLKAEHYPLDSAIEQAYTDSEAVILEVDMKEMTAPRTQQKIMQKALLPQGRTLQGLISVNTHKKLSSTCSKMKLPVSTLEPFKPWFAAMTLTLVKTQSMGFDPQYGLDKYFYDKAGRDSKKIIGLETVDFQIDLFDSLSESNPDDFIARTLNELDRIEEDLADLEKAWLSGSIEEVGMLMTKSFEDYPELYKTFVLDRNQHWIKKLDALLKKPTRCMVVVGAGHLPGKGGLLQLLKNNGYTIEQL